MYIAIIVGISFLWLGYNVVQACIKPTPIIEDKNKLLKDFCGKSKSECNNILKEYKR